MWIFIILCQHTTFHTKNWAQEKDLNNETRYCRKLYHPIITRCQVSSITCLHYTFSVLQVTILRFTEESVTETKDKDIRKDQNG